MNSASLLAFFLTFTVIHWAPKLAKGEPAAVCSLIRRVTEGDELTLQPIVGTQTAIFVDQFRLHQVYRFRNFTYVVRGCAGTPCIPGDVPGRTTLYARSNASPGRTWSSHIGIDVSRLSPRSHWFTSFHEPRPGIEIGVDCRRFGTISADRSPFREGQEE